MADKENVPVSPSVDEIMDLPTEKENQTYAATLDQNDIPELDQLEEGVPFELTLKGTVVSKGKSGKIKVKISSAIVANENPELPAETPLQNNLAGDLSGALKNLEI